MVCPECGSEMQSGEIQVVTSFWIGLFAGGRTGWFQQMLFHRPDQQQPETIRKALLNHPASHCEKCRTVVLPGSKSQSWWP